MLRISLLPLALVSTGFLLFSNHSIARDWSTTELVGTHIFESANGFALFSETHLMWILTNNQEVQREGEKVDLLASLKGEAVGGTYQVTGENRMTLNISHSMDAEMVGQQWHYEMQWLDQNRIRFWVLNPDGLRSERTGIARKIN